MRVLRSLHWLDVPHDSPQLATDEFQQFMQGCFPPLYNSDRSWKRTEANRLRELDERLVAILQAQGRHPRVFMDVGMANGVSTVATIQCFERAGLPVQTIATDRNLVGYVFRVNRHVDVLAEENGHILLIEGPGWDVVPCCERGDFRTGHFFVSVLKRGITAWARRQVAKRGLPLSARVGEAGGVSGAVAGPFLLVTPELKNRPDVVVRQDDLLEPLPVDLAGVADVVRIENVLRPDRFSPAQLQHVAVNVRQRCRDGAILLVGRHKGKARERPDTGSTFFQAVQGGFRVLERVGAGSEVERYFATV
jgi:hypothetical protein